MQALVTGAGGFLGRYIVEALVARGDRVRGLARGDYPELTALGVEMIRGDVRNGNTVASACRDMDCVFHTAAIAGIGMRWDDYFLTNTVGTENVLAACLQHGVARLVFTSSPSVTFGGFDQCGVDESCGYQLDWQSQNKCHYSRSKALAELLVLAAGKGAIDLQTGKAGSLRTCALRPHLIWGPRDAHLIPRLIARAHSGRLRRVGDGTNLVDMIYVENAAEAHLLAADALAKADSPAAGKAYFLSQGEPVNCWQWIDEILALVDLPPVKKSISLPAARRVGLACETLWRIARLPGEPPMTRFLASQLAKSHWFDISAARRDFGYEPRVSADEGMGRLGKWLRNSL